MNLNTRISTRCQAINYTCGMKKLSNNITVVQKENQDMKL